MTASDVLNRPLAYSAGSSSEDARNRADRRFSAYLLIGVFGAFVAGAYPIALSLGGLRVQIWRPLAVSAALIVVAAAVRSRSTGFPFPLRFVALVALWTGWGLFSFLWAPSTASGMIELFGLVTGASIAVAVAVLASRDRRHLELLLQCWTVGLALQSLVAGVEVATGWHLPSDFAATHAELGLRSDFVTGTFGNSNDFASFLLLGIPFCLAGVGTWRSALARRAALFVAVISAMFIVVSNSRLCTLGLVVGAGVYAMLLKPGWSRPYRTRAIYASVLAFPPIVVALRPSLIEKFGNLADEWAQGGSARDRFQLIRFGWDLATSTAFRGVGIGGFEPSAAGQITPVGSNHDTNPHNFVIELLSQYGIVITMLFAIWMIGLANAVRHDRLAEVAVGADSFRLRISTAAIVGFALFIPASSDPSAFIEQGTGWLFIGSLIAIGLALPGGRERA